jgi:hypothetical protein
LVKAVICPIELGIVLVMLHLARVNEVKAVICCIELGIVPLKEFWGFE